jgi:peroxiredoxin
MICTPPANNMIKPNLLPLIVVLLLATGIFAQSSLRPGNPAPAFSATDLSGKQHDLFEMRGSVVVVTFWSTRCQICHREIPKLNNFVTRYADKPVVFLALSTESDDKIKAYLKSYPTNLLVLPNSFGVVLQYADRDKNGNIDMGFPSYFVIDTAGKIAYRSYGWDKTKELENKIAQLINSD